MTLDLIKGAIVLLHLVLLILAIRIFNSSKLPIWKGIFFLPLIPIFGPIVIIVITYATYFSKKGKDERP